MRYFLLIHLAVIIPILAVYPAAAEIPESLEISGPDTVEQLNVAYFGVFLGGDPNQYIIEWSCDPESAGYFTTPQQVGTGFVTASLDVLSSLDVVISVRIATSDGDEVVLHKTLTITSGMPSGSWSISLDEDVYVQDIAMDRMHNVYILGGFDKRIDFDPGSGEDIRTQRGYDGDFLTSYDTQGNYRWTISIDRGDEGQEWMHSVVVTSRDEIIAMGKIGPEVHLDRGDKKWDYGTNEIYDTGFALRFTPDGEFLGFIQFWDYSDVTRGGISDVYQLVEDNNGSMYVAGNFSGRLDFDLGPGQDLTNYDGGFFFLKMDGDFNIEWSQAFGGASTYFLGDGQGICLTPDGSLIASGSYYDPVSFNVPSDRSGDITSSTGDEGSFLCEINSDGELVRNVVLNQYNFGGLNFTGLVADLDGGIYGWGEAPEGVDLDPGDGEYFLDTGSVNYRFFIKLSPNFDLADPLDQFPPVSDFLVAANGDYYAAGTIIGTIDLDPGPAEMEVTAARSSAYVIRLDRDYNLIEHWIVPYESGSRPVLAVSDDGLIALAMGSNAPLVVYLNPKNR